MNNNVCRKNQMLPVNSQTTILMSNNSVKAKNHVGIDIKDARYYYKMIKEKNIILPLRTGINVNDLLKLYADLHNLGDATYGNPVCCITKNNEIHMGGFTALSSFRTYNVYQYYDRDKQLTTNLENVDLIRDIYEKLLGCYLSTAVAELSNYEENDRRCLFVERSYDVAKQLLDNNYVNRKDIVKKHVDSEFGEGKFDLIENSDEMNYYEKKERFICLYREILLKDYPKHKVQDELTMYNVLNISCELHTMRLNGDNYRLFKKEFMTLSGF